MRIHTIEGVNLIHINEYCELTQRTVTSCRHLIEDGNLIRKMKFYRVRSQLFIPVEEITGYPFQKNGAIYHYRIKDGLNEPYERYLCETCSFTNEKCSCRQAADDLFVPEGDK